MRECVREDILQSYYDGELSSEMMESVASHLTSCLACAHAARELESESELLSQALEPEFALSVPSERLRHRIDAAIAGLHVLRPAGAGAFGVAGVTPGLIRRWGQSVAELFTLAPRGLAYAGIAAVLLFATVMGGLFWRGAGPDKNNQTTASNRAGRNEVKPSATVSPSPSPATVASPTPQPAPTTAPAPRRRPLSPRPVPEQFAGVQLLPGERSYLKTIASLDATIKAESKRPMKPALQVEYERNLAMVDRAIAATRNAAKNNPDDPDAADFMFAAYQSKVDLLNQVADSRLSNRPHQ